MAAFSNTLAELNKIINQDMEIIQQRAISSLILNKAYIIKNLVIVNTRFGKSALVTLFDESENSSFKSFLPKRITEHLTENIIKEINSSDTKYTLTYLGQSPPFYSGARTRSLLKFDLY